VQSFQFVTGVVFWYNILFHVNMTSKMLQDPSLDICEAEKQLEKTKEFLQKYRSDSGFQEAIHEANELAEQLDLDPRFPEASHSRPRKKRAMFGYESVDEPILDPSQNFKINFFYAVLDVVIQSVEERFRQLTEYNNIFGFLNYCLKIPSTDLKEKCKKLEKALADGEKKDVDGMALYEEIQCLAQRTELTKSPRQILEFLCETRMCAVLPNLTIALRIMLTVPVSVASGERSFSKLKLIKNYLRTSMSQQRMNDLAILSVEQEMAAKIDIGILAHRFASVKVRRVNFF
jgi:hypothetical protein